MMGAPLPMFCLGCEYNLRGTASGQCPECGRPFELADRATWGATPAWRRNPGRRLAIAAAWVLCPGPLWAAGGLGVEYFLAWSVLGHEPAPMRDDPKSINLVLSALHSLVGFSLLFSPLISGAAIGIAGVLLRVRGLKAKWIALIAFACWPLSIVICLLYPANVRTWWWD